MPINAKGEAMGNIGSKSKKKAAPKTSEELLRQLKDEGSVAASVIRIEWKNWQQVTLTGKAYFIHCTRSKPDEIRNHGGLDPQFSKEACLSGALSGYQILGAHRGQFVLAGVISEFPTEEEIKLDLPGFVKIHGYLGRAKKSVYNDGYIYLFELDPDAQEEADEQPSTCYTPTGQVHHNSEAGFDQLIPYTCMRVYGQYNAKTKTCKRVADWT